LLVFKQHWLRSISISGQVLWLYQVKERAFRSVFIHVKEWGFWINAFNYELHNNNDSMLA
jgi:hypothetical protein